MKEHLRLAANETVFVNTDGTNFTFPYTFSSVSDCDLCMVKNALWHDTSAQNPASTPAQDILIVNSSITRDSNPIAALPLSFTTNLVNGVNLVASSYVEHRFIPKENLRGVQYFKIIYNDARTSAPTGHLVLQLEFYKYCPK